MENEVEKSTIHCSVLIEGGRAHALVWTRSMTMIDENDQHHTVAVNDIPNEPPTPPVTPEEPAP
jgi:hypothetical protein